MEPQADYCSVGVMVMMQLYVVTGGQSLLSIGFKVVDITYKNNPSTLTRVVFKQTSQSSFAAQICFLFRRALPRQG